MSASATSSHLNWCRAWPAPCWCRRWYSLRRRRAGRSRPKLPVPAIDQSAIAQRGYFYVGGKYTGEPGKEIMQGQFYVEVLAPKDVRRPYPLVLIHGAAQTATNWMGTPDGQRVGRNISSSKATSST